MSDARAWFRTEIAGCAIVQTSLKAARRALGPDDPRRAHPSRAKARGRLGALLVKGARDPRHLCLARAFVEGRSYRRLERYAPSTRIDVSIPRLFIFVRDATKGAAFAGLTPDQALEKLEAWLKAPMSHDDALVFLHADCRTLALRLGGTGVINVRKRIVSGIVSYLATAENLVFSATSPSDLTALAELKRLLLAAFKDDTQRKRRAASLRKV